MAKIPNFNCKDVIKITEGIKLIPEHHQDGCFFRCVLKYDSNKEIKSDSDVKIKVGFNVFADDKLGRAANVWDAAFPTRTLKNGKTQTVFEWYKSDSNVTKDNFWTSYLNTFGTYDAKSLKKGRKVQLAVGYKYLTEATKVYDKNGSCKIADAKWSDVEWLQYKGESKDGIYKQTGFICGCPETWECSRIKDASWCWPGNTKDFKDVESYKNSDKHYFQDIPTVPCNYTEIYEENGSRKQRTFNWDKNLGGFRFAAIKLKLMARIQHNSPYWGDGVVNYDFYSTSGNNFANNDMFENAKRSRIPQGDNEWDILGTFTIVFAPIDCRKAAYGLTDANANVGFYYNFPRNSDLKWGDRFDTDDGTSCRYGFKLKQPNFALDREVEYKEKSKNHDAILNDNNHHLYFGKYDSKNANRLPRNKSSFLYNMKDITAPKWRPAQIDCGYEVKYKLKRYGDAYKNLSSEVAYTIYPPDLTGKPSISIQEYTDKTTKKKVRKITYNNVENGKNIFYIPSTLNLKKNEYTYEGNKWKLIRKKRKKSQQGTYVSEFKDFSSIRYRFRYGDIYKFNDNHTYYLMYDTTEVVVKKPDPTMEVYSTELKDGKYKMLLDENSQGMLKTLIIPFTEITYMISATEDDGAPYLTPYDLYIKVTNGKTDSEAAEITKIDGIPPEQSDKEPGYFKSKSSKSTHTVTIRYKNYDSKNVTLDYFGINGDDQIDGDIKENGNPFKTTLFFPNTFKRYNHLENTFSNLKVCYVKGGKQVKLYPYLHKKIKK